MKKIAVLGGGISGYGSAILAKKKGFDVFLSDAGRIADRYKAKLDEWQVPYEEGGHTEERILDAAEVVKSPGIPETAPLVRKLRAAFRTTYLAIGVLIDDIQKKLAVIADFAVRTNALGGHRFGVNGKDARNLAAGKTTFDNRLAARPTDASRIAISFKMRFD